MCVFFFYCSAYHRDLHSFPTRRSSDLVSALGGLAVYRGRLAQQRLVRSYVASGMRLADEGDLFGSLIGEAQDRKSTRLNSSHTVISYAVFCLKKKKKRTTMINQPRTHP